MSTTAAVAVSEPRRVFRFILDELKPRGPWLTPFNVISIPIILTGLVIKHNHIGNRVGMINHVPAFGPCRITNMTYPDGFYLQQRM